MSLNMQALKRCAQIPCCFPERGRDGQPLWCPDNWRDDVAKYCPSCLARWQIDVIDGVDDTCEWKGDCEDCPERAQCEAAQDDDMEGWKRDVRN